MSSTEAATLNAPRLSPEAIQAAIRESEAIRAVTGVEQAQLPTDDQPPSNGTLDYSEALTRGALAQRAPMTARAQMGPFHADIRFGDGIPVGGWSQLTLHPNGAWNFSGHLHDSGFPSYNDVVTWGVQSVRTGDVYVVRHAGHMAGTYEFGSRDDDWGDSGINPALAQGWDMLAPAWRWHCRAYVNWDFAGAVGELLQIIAAAQAIGKVIMLF